MPNAEDVVNHPNHYISNSGLESIDVIKAFTENLSGYEAYATGNILKYVMRWKSKNGLEDLKKARWYLDSLIEKVEGPHSYFSKVAKQTFDLIEADKQKVKDGLMTAEEFHAAWPNEEQIMETFTVTAETQQEYMNDLFMFQQGLMPNSTFYRKWPQWKIDLLFNDQTYTTLPEDDSRD